MARTEIVNEAVQRIIDGSTGEIIEEHQSIGTRTIFKQEPPYVKLYLEDMLYMRDMPKSLSGLTYSLAKRSTYADNDDGLCVYLPTYVKQQILEECGYEKMQSLNNALVKLCKGEIIRRLGTGAYQLNPYLFGRGDWKAIERIRMTWDYDGIKGKTFSTSFSYTPEEQAAIDARTAKKAARASRKPKEAQEPTEAPLPGQTALEGVTEAQEARSA